MRFPILCSALVLLLAPLASAQIQPHGGGGWGGPGDTVPQPKPDGGGPAAPEGPANPGPQPGDASGPGAPGAGPAVNPGALRPPPGTPSPFDPPAAPETPSSRPRVDQPESWQIWWHYNRWEHLPLGGRPERLAESDGSGFFLGRGARPRPPAQPKVRETEARDAARPALERVLREERGPELLVSSLHALAKLRFDLAEDAASAAEAAAALRPLEDHVRALFDDGNPDVSAKALLALGIRGSDRYASLLVGVLGTPSGGIAPVFERRVGYQQRAYAAFGLGLVAERTLDPRVRQSLYAALAFGLADPREEVAASSLLALGWNPLPLAADTSEGPTLEDELDAVLALFRDPRAPTRVRAHAPYALGRLAADAPAQIRGPVVHALLEAVSTHSSEPREVQSGAVIALGKLGNSGASELDREIRAELERVGYRSSAGRLTRYLAMVALGEAAGRRGDGEEPFEGLDHARKLFLRTIARTRGNTLCWTVLALGLLEEHAAQRGAVPAPESAAALREVFERNRSSEVAGATALALGLLRDEEAVPLLLERLAESGEGNALGYTALALGMIGTQRAAEPLRALLPRCLGQPTLLENLATALALVGDPGAGPWLFEALHSASNPEAQAALASALGWTRDPRPLRRLCERLEDDSVSRHGRAWTAVAIGRIADTDDVPWVGRHSVGVNFDVESPLFFDLELAAGLFDLP